MTPFKLGAIDRDSGNVGMRWKNIKKCVIHSTSDLVGKVEKKGRMLWITLEMAGEMHERRK
jgi:hypothetical protein